MSIPKEANYTYYDYLQWNEDEAVELIDGTVYAQAQPSPLHEEIIVELVRQIANYLEAKRCKVYSSRLDVKLFANSEDSERNINTVVVPDLSIVCDSSKIDQRGCNGAPDMITEVLSPSTAKRDRYEKLKLYQRAGVKEYWIVDPVEQSVQVYVLENKHYNIVGYYTKEEIVKVNVLDGCFVELAKVFK